MTRISYTVAGLAALCLLASCNHKLIGEFSDKSSIIGRDLLINYNWEKVATGVKSTDNNIVEIAFTDVLSTHVMPVGRDYHLDTLILAPEEGTIDADRFNSTLFPSRFYRHSHFAGNYDIFTININPEDLDMYLDTSDMAHSIPTIYELEKDELLYEVPLGGGDIKEDEIAEMSSSAKPVVPVANELPFARIDQGIIEGGVYYGVRKNVAVTPGKQEHEIFETELEMKEFAPLWIAIDFNTDISLNKQGMKDSYLSYSGIYVTGLAGNYDLLNDKAFDGYSEVFRDYQYFENGREDCPYWIYVQTPGITDYGKIEVYLFGAVEAWKEDYAERYYWYRKADITEKVREALEDPATVEFQLDLFKDGAVLGEDAVARTGNHIVWNVLE